MHVQFLKTREAFHKMDETEKRQAMALALNKRERFIKIMKYFDYMVWGWCEAGSR